MRRAIAVEVTDLERTRLNLWARGWATAARLVLRAKIILLAATGQTNENIAAELATDAHTVARWRKRFAAQRLPGFEQDAPRGGRPSTVRQALTAEIIRVTTQENPRKSRPRAESAG